MKSALVLYRLFRPGAPEIKTNNLNLLKYPENKSNVNQCTVRGFRCTMISWAVFSSLTQVAGSTFAFSWLWTEFNAYFDLIPSGLIHVPNSLCIKLNTYSRGIYQFFDNLGSQSKLHFLCAVASGAVLSQDRSLTRGWKFYSHSLDGELLFCKCAQKKSTLIVITFLFTPAGSYVVHGAVLCFPYAVCSQVTQHKRINTTHKHTNTCNLLKVCCQFLSLSVRQSSSIWIVLSPTLILSGS